MSWTSISYFLLWAAAFALMMRFGCGAHVFGHRHEPRNAGDSDVRHSPEGSKDEKAAKSTGEKDSHASCH